MSEIEKITHSEITALPVQRIIGFLDALGLPSDNIIAGNSQRALMNKNLPDYILSLPDEVKSEARYLSKYVVGAGFGLFDYSLNAIWNEVTIALRNKAITYGLDIFFDAAVGAKIREAYKTEDDLAGLKDIVLLDTCKKLELISETTYKKLAHILDMRNDIGISHPTNYTINAFELLGWLQACVEDVLLDKPSDAAIQIKAFLDNLKNETNVIDGSHVAKILPEFKNLSSYHCSRILTTLFGIYVSPDTSQTLRKNIALLATTVWNNSLDDPKYKLGISLEGYRNNLHTFKYEKGGEFFNIVKGNNFRTQNEKLVALNDLTDELVSANSGFDNYYHEVPPITKILTYIKSGKDIPVEISADLIHVILKCRIGRGYSYNNGVSPTGKALYDKFFTIMREEFIPTFITELVNSDVRVKVRNDTSTRQLVDLITLIRKNTVNERYLEALDYLIENLPKNNDAMLDKEFKKITSAFLKWPEK